jgi:hypothetical protein
MALLTVAGVAIPMAVLAFLVWRDDRKQERSKYQR